MENWHSPLSLLHRPCTYFIFIFLVLSQKAGVAVSRRLLKMGRMCILELAAPQAVLPFGRCNESVGTSYRSLGRWVERNVSVGTKFGLSPWCSWQRGCLTFRVTCGCFRGHGRNSSSRDLPTNQKKKERGLSKHRDMGATARSSG